MDKGGILTQDLTIDQAMKSNPLLELLARKVESDVELDRQYKTSMDNLVYYAHTHNIITW